MYENIFNRIEQKYLLSTKQYSDFMKMIKQFIKEDEYFSSVICNIYFDNDNLDMIIHSIEKPIFKQKVRLRSYNTPKSSDDVYLEVKTKYQKNVSKRRIKVNLEEFEHYMETKEYDYNSQIMKEIDYLFCHYNLKPVYYLAYDRLSYKGIEDETLRITIDDNLRSRKDNLYLEKSDGCHPYFKDKTYIMEIKYSNALPLWLVSCLSKLSIYPISFSKVGNIYMKEKEK